MINIIVTVATAFNLGLGTVTVTPLSVVSASPQPQLQARSGGFTPSEAWVGSAQFLQPAVNVVQEAGQGTMFEPHTITPEQLQPTYNPQQ